jgi:hypothetical protein
LCRCRLEAGAPPSLAALKVARILTAKRESPNSRQL